MKSSSRELVRAPKRIRSQPGARRRASLWMQLASVLCALTVFMATLPAAAARLTYDSANRLVRSDDGETTISYKYDGLGNLSRACVLYADAQSECVDIVVDPSAQYPAIVGEIGAGNTNLYAYGPAGLAAVSRNGQTYVPLQDHQGSVRGLVDGAGEIAGRVAYDPYGQVRARVGEQISLGYTGEWTSAHGIVYLRSRSYAPDIGRFLQRDGYRGELPEPLSLNRYTYAHNNPSLLSDPGGHAVIALAIGAVIGATFLFFDMTQPALAPEYAGDMRGSGGPSVGQQLARGVAMEIVGGIAARIVFRVVVRPLGRLLIPGVRKLASGVTQRFSSGSVRALRGRLRPPTPSLPRTAPYEFDELMSLVTKELDVSTRKGGAVFWSGPRMSDAQAWALRTGKTTLEQTRGGKVLESLNLFDPSSGLTGQQASEIWDAASRRFAEQASGEVSAFTTGATRTNAWGNLRTFWRVEEPALLNNPNVTGIVQRNFDGTPMLR